MSADKINWKSSCFYNLPNRLKQYKNIYIYGAGKIAKYVLIYLDEVGLSDKLNGIVTSNNGGGIYLIS